MYSLYSTECLVVKDRVVYLGALLYGTDPGVCLNAIPGTTIGHTGLSRVCPRVSNLTAHNTDTHNNHKTAT